jgi:Ankyrin repeat
MQVGDNNHNANAVEASLGALLEALAQYQPLATIRDIVEKHPKVLMAKDARGCTPLHCAAHEGDDIPWDVMEYLVQQCPEAMRESSALGKLPLDVATERADTVQMVQLLANAFPHALDARDHEGNTPLHTACAYEVPVEVVVFLALKGPRSLLERNALGYLPLHIAAERDLPLAVIRFLMAEGSQALREPSHDGSLPLHVAAAVPSSLEAVQVLTRAFPGALQATMARGYLSPARRSQELGAVDRKDPVAGRPSAFGRRNKDERRISPAAFGHPTPLVRGGSVPCPPVPFHGAGTDEGRVVPAALRRPEKGIRVVVRDASQLFPQALEQVQLLAGMFPQALQERTSKGYLPLHIAALHNAPLTVVYFLARTWPEAVTVPVRREPAPSQSNLQVASAPFDCRALLTYIYS